MEICMKEILKKLRHQKNITQEQLANHLGISYQSVGKWERGEGLPDISLIPEIALYFGITSDELLGIDRGRIDQKIADYENRSSELCRNEMKTENLALWQEAYHTFPEDHRVQKGYIDALYRVCSMKHIIVIDGKMQPWELDPELKKNCEEILSVGEHLLLTCTDRKITDTVVDILCHTAHHIGNLPLAKEYAERLGSYTCTRESQLQWLLDRDASIRQAQENMMAYLRLMTFSMQAIIIQKNIDSHERIACDQLIIDIWNLILGENDRSFYQQVLGERYFSLAVQTAVCKNTNECLSALEQMADRAIRCDLLQHDNFTVPWLDGLTYSKSSLPDGYYLGQCRRSIKWLTENEIFDFIRNEPRFIHVMERLREIAEEV